MLKKFAAVMLVAALVCTLGVPRAFAQNKPSLDADSNRISNSDVDYAGKQGMQSGARLKASIQKLVADARAGKGVSVSDPQNLPRQSNGLSKGAKIAIVAVIAVVVILIVIVVHSKNHFFDDALIFQ